MKPVVIVGAGLAGLTCARALKRRRIPFLLLDGDDRVGGRVKTDTVGPFRIDRGYQVYFTAYPHAREQIDEERLHLKRYEPGAIIVWDGEHHLVSRDSPLQFAVSGFLSTSDKLRLAKWTSNVQWLDQADIDEIPDRTIEQYLHDEGFSNDFIDRFARPFLGGVFLDRSLQTSCRQLLFVWKAMSEGEATVPEQGMEEIPRQLGVTIGHEWLRLGAKVVELLKKGDAVTGVRLDSGEVIESDRVVLACDAMNAGALSGKPIPAEFLHSITIYFRAAEQPVDGRWVVMSGNMRGITNHVIPLANANSVEAGNLIGATILGEKPETDEQLAEIVKSEMRVWFPNRDVDSWQLFRAYRAKNAQMVQHPGFQSRLPGNDSGIPGLYYAGEFTTNSSIDGAIESGQECADLIMSGIEAGVP